MILNVNEINEDEDAADEDDDDGDDALEKNSLALILPKKKPVCMYTCGFRS